MARRDIQLEILTLLLRSQGLKFSEARPKDIENDLYNYHLQYLVKEGLVEKIEDKYHLTLAGKIEANQVDAQGNRKRFMKVAVLMGLIRMNNGQLEVLNHTRLRHPLYGDKGVHAGTVKPGEKILDAAKRKFKEETSIDAEFTFLGVIRKMRYTLQETPIDDTLFHVCLSNKFNGEPVPVNEFGEHYWVSIAEAIHHESISKGKSAKFLEVLQILQSESDFTRIPLFYVEEKEYFAEF